LPTQTKSSAPVSKRKTSSLLRRFLRTVPDASSVNSRRPDASLSLQSRKTPGQLQLTTATNIRRVRLLVLEELLGGLSRLVIVAASFGGLDRPEAAEESPEVGLLGVVVVLLCECNIRRRRS
jgi:hypothetical protein